MSYFSKKGFTLIELLVVISIMSALSSVVFASLSTARDKAKIAAGQTFSGQMYRALGAEAIGVWGFDEPSGNAFDTSGNNINLVFNGGVTRQSDTPVKRGSSVYFDGAAGSYLLNPATSASYAYTQSSMTAGLWIKPVNLIGTGDGVIVVNSYPVRTVNFHLYPTGILAGPCSGWQLFPYTLKLNEWQHIAYSYLGGEIYLYVNGKLIDKKVATGACDITANPVSQIMVARYIGGGYNYTGYVDDVGIYTRALSASEVYRVFARSAPEYGVAVR